MDWVISKDFAITDIHASGHEDIEKLKEFTGSINP